MKKFFLCLITIICCGCGSGGSDADSRIVLEGTLTEAGGAHHAPKAINFRHGIGARIGDVEVCALGQCSTTDDQGQWGFVSPDGFAGGEIELSVNGHGIATSTVIEIPKGVANVFIELQHVEGGIIEAHVESEGGEVEHTHS